MSDADFTHDVFSRHCAEDQGGVRPIAERLRADGLKGRFDEWETAQANNATQKPASEFQRSAFSLQPFLALSAKAFGSDWAQLEAGTFGRGNLLEPQLAVSRPAEEGSPLHSPAARHPSKMI